MNWGRRRGRDGLLRRNKKYLSTDLLREEPVKPDHRTPHIQLLGFRAMNRVCGVCFDPSDPTSAPAGFYSIARR